MSGLARRNGWTLGIVSVALFMVVLDNLVVSVALPTIHRDLGRLDPVARVDGERLRARLRGPAAHRARRSAIASGASACSSTGMALFTAASAAAALAPSTGLLVAARAIQGTGAALVTPADPHPARRGVPRQEQRGIAIGVWSGISGIAVAIGPLVGGAVVQGISWHWIFWINVPIGIALVPLAARLLSESHGPYGTLDLPRPRARLERRVRDRLRPRARAVARLDERHRAREPRSAAVLAARRLRRLGAARRRADAADVASSRKRSFAVTNVVSLSMYFGMFGSIFFLSQYMQNVLHNTPLQAGLKLLVWTGASMVVAPLAGVFSERLGSRPFMVAGLSLQAGGARMAREHALHAPGLLADDRPVHDGRRGHGARVRALGQRGALLGARPAGRPGLRRQQRDPRGRRRARGRGARIGVHRRRQLRLPAGVRQRAAARRCGSAWRCSRPVRSPRWRCPSAARGLAGRRRAAAPAGAMLGMRDRRRSPGAA